MNIDPIMASIPMQRATCKTASLLVIQLQRLPIVAVILLLVVCLQAAEADDATAQSKHLQAALQLLGEGNADKALREEITPVIEHFEAKYARESRQVFCARTTTERLAYLLGASTTSKPVGAVAIGPEWATAYFMKAYALIELDRLSEARTNLTLALKLSPQNSQFLSELAHLYQREKKWAESQKLFIEAEACARAYSPEDVKTAELTRALRGQGYNLVELEKYGEAEAKYRECLKVNPKDQTALAELDHLKTLQERMKSRQQ